ncbi:hypothetical protein J2R76_006002 [Bradyrhizobium sp. USDA 4532]|nr:hypothetical protein [Bradyrhizobium sp. USDA 4545]MCP1922411.1 hypothetical protein [Bradyrhizobium sp. USDA 4532]
MRNPPKQIIQNARIFNGEQWSCGADAKVREFSEF